MKLRSVSHKSVLVPLDMLINLGEETLWKKECLSTWGGLRGEGSFPSEKFLFVLGTSFFGHLWSGFGGFIWEWVTQWFWFCGFLFEVLTLSGTLMLSWLRYWFSSCFTFSTSCCQALVTSFLLIECGSGGSYEYFFPNGSLLGAKPVDECWVSL